MRTRILAVVIGSMITTGIATLPAVAPATAAPADWPMCGPTDTEDCVVLATVNGKPIPAPVTGTPRDYPWVRATANPRTIAFGVSHNPTGDGPVGTETDAVDPTKVYRLVVRTGVFFPDELNSTTRGTRFSVGLNSYDESGYEFAVTFQPTPIRHLSGGCTVTTCTDAPADRELAGYARGVVRNTYQAAEIPAPERSRRRGTFLFTDAQDQRLSGDFATRSFTVRLANPSHTSGGAPITNTFTAFLPHSYLLKVLQIPYPGTLKGSSFTVVRTIGSSKVQVPIQATYDAARGGAFLRLTGPASTLTSYLVRAKPTPPGRPRVLGARKTGPHRAYVGFLAPNADGGKPVTLNQARCRKPTRPWHYAPIDRGADDVVYVSGLPTGKVVCQARVRNAVGWGKWSGLVTARPA